ncbi:MAG: hypothetical protein K2X35_26240, partial [Bryobacteraceae bacterium]|nr:hypothetical protein [Bryobacteraceae bacterium]
MSATQAELSTEQRDSTVRILALALADEYLLYTKTRNYHWNVTVGRPGISVDSGLGECDEGEIPCPQE